MLTAALTKPLRHVMRDRRGNMLMIFAFALLPITFATGMSIDYASAMRLQTRLNAIADAAALSAVTSPMMKSGMDVACQAARSTFESQATGIAGLTINTKLASNLTITITDTLSTGTPVTITCPVTGLPLNIPSTTPLSRTAAVTYAAQSTNSFAGILGKASLDIGSTASAKTTVAPYIDIHLALDTSQSMGLAATDAEAQRLWQATGQLNGRSCQFGCHVRDPNERYSMEAIARMTAPDGKPVARMRIDVLRDATIDMIDTASAGQGTAQNYQFAVYRIGKNNGRWNPGIDRYVPLTTNLSTVRSTVSSLDLSDNDGSVGFGDTDMPSATGFILPYMNATSAAYDDGTTQAKARKFLSIVTDGVTDVEGPCIWGHCTQPLDPATCNAYKQKGITIGVVYTTYLPTKSNPMNPSDPGLRHEYVYLIQPIADQIKPALQQCASPGWFFEGSDASTIHAAMQALFKQATQTPSIIR